MTVSHVAPADPRPTGRRSRCWRSGIFQALLNAIGWVLAWIYDLVGNYGLSIILLTILIKVVLLPLGVKQIKSMQAMQSIQPKVKELQKKYKGNKTKVQEETMKLYKEAGVNPLGGCLPLLLQFPILIAMYAVIRAPQLQPVDDSGQQVASEQATAYAVHNSHLPIDSQLFEDVVDHQNLGFLGMNLQCSAAQSGKDAEISSSDRSPVRANTPIVVVTDGTVGSLPFDATTGAPIPGTVTNANPDGIAGIDCGSSPANKIPYFALLIVMIGTTFYQQRQMQKASPPGAASGQQQAILKLMPIMFGIFGYTFPAGLTLYWTVEHMADRTAIRPAEGRPYRPGCDGAPDRSSSGEEREQIWPPKPDSRPRMQEAGGAVAEARAGQAAQRLSSGTKSTGNSAFGQRWQEHAAKGSSGSNTGGARWQATSQVARLSSGEHA